MYTPTTPESAISLDVPVTDKRDTYHAQVPRKWADLLLLAATHNGHDRQVLVKELTAGRVALSVLFGYADLAAVRARVSREGGTFCAVEGGIVPNGGHELRLSTGTIGEQNEGTAIIFRRSSENEPYMPHSYVLGQQAPQPCGALIAEDGDSQWVSVLSRFALPTEVVTGDLGDSSLEWKRAAYVRIDRV